MKIIRIFILLVFASAFVVPSFDEETQPFLDKSATPLHLWVQFQENPSREAVISWTTTVPGERHVLYYDSIPRNSRTRDYRFRSNRIHSGEFTISQEEIPMETWYHHAYINGLEPDTFYYVTVETDGEVLGEYHFKTAPEDDSPVSVLIGGDSRIASGVTDPENPRVKMNLVMRDLMLQDPRIVGLAHTGDYSDRARWSDLYFWLTDYFENSTTPEGRLLPIFPSQGNHDLRIGFQEIFWWPERENFFYYTAHINDSTALLVLNTEISLNGDQRTWLEAELKELDPETNSLAALFHRGAFPSVKAYEDGAPRRRSWVPLFEEYELDFVVSGHGHSLKRTLPILNLEPSPEGIIYLGDGGLGVRPRKVDRNRWYLEGRAMAESISNVHLVQYQEEAIKIQAVGIDGEVVDSLNIPRDRRLREAYYEELLPKEEPPVF